MTKTTYPSDTLSSFRFYQFIATIVKNMLVIDLGLICALPVILIAALTGISNQHNRDEYLSITVAEASWLGKSKL